MDFTEFFDPMNKEHCAAFRDYYRGKGWPEGFLPKDIYFPPGWELEIIADLAVLWLDWKIDID